MFDEEKINLHGGRKNKEREREKGGRMRGRGE